MVDWAVSATRVPQSLTAAHLRPLREAGLDDRAILDLCLVTAYFNFVNRIALGLGVHLEPGGPPHPSRD